MDGYEKIMSTYTTYVSEFEEDIDKDTEDDSSDPFFPRAGEDETEFAISGAYAE
ncbi:hypothetical protein IFR04_009941 [Cadophora malorum]|uniref:Uncharacterized protein n=1 Tax=Cadophora malorum TaxID=108018 RepID=A0A8H7TDM8_9HELO|nr:hypothetical protein IFR04_009941 [Cadophora malorum]|tara:strand:- start:341 stop:502 length:162 start_codon:yes stop_codon:yes gene_type:complete